MSQSIQPLRIQKNASSFSPKKMNGTSVYRPLAELSPMEMRRNSPSYNQSSKAMLGNDSSPFDSSPFASNSPRLYWQNRDSASPNRLSAENRNPFEQREASPSPAKRSSIENLKRASRVKNSNMFAREHKHEYDPTSSPMIERPLANGRPLNTQQGTMFPINGSDGFRNNKAMEETANFPAHNPLKSPIKLDAVPEPQKPSVRDQTSPTKSSLSKNSRYAQAQAFDPENGMWSDDEESIAERQLPPGKALHGHMKSVTFDAAPPQINEYEMTTPDPSSAASGSREGSYESGDGEEDESFDRGSSIDREDSFDASLEDADKTPVVLPEDWRFMSPVLANDQLAVDMEDPFDGEQSSPAPNADPKIAIDVRDSPTRTDSVNSNGERRPLPPLPALDLPIIPRARSDSNNSLLAAAARLSNSQRMLPSPPRPASITKSEVLGMGGCSMSIEDRLRLMVIQDQEKSKTPAEEQRERRLRRGDAREKSVESEPETNGNGIQIHEDEIENDDVADLGEYQLPPRISRESILRKVKSQSQLLKEPEYEYSSPTPSSSPDRDPIHHMDPDTPLPSLEERTVANNDSVMIKQEEDEDEIDVYSIPDMYRLGLSQVDSKLGFEGNSIDDTRSNCQGDDDDESHYSTDLNADLPREPQSKSTIEDDGPLTPRAQSPNQQVQVKESKSSHRMSLPQFASMLGSDDFGLGLQSYMTPTPPVEPTKSEIFFQPGHISPPVQRPVTPEEQLDPPRFPGYGNDTEEEPGTPDSVIRHSFPEVSMPDSPAVPEPVATIKAPGSKLKSRPSLTPIDVQEMAETRRQVSAQLPVVSPVAESHGDGSSQPDDSSSVEQELALDVDSGDPIKQEKRKSSLVQLEIPVEELEEGLSFGLDREFDRVIEGQKVAFDISLSNLYSASTLAGSSQNTKEQLFRRNTRNYANILPYKQKGYLMRQNTKVVVASSNLNENTSDTADDQGPAIRGTRSAGNSPRKPSHTQTWTTEPWNGKVRRKSVRLSAGSPQKRTPSGPVPPLPGQTSNVSNGLDSVTEDQAMPTSDEVEDGIERGRLFVKVVGVKELDLPLPKGERSYFALTLDNGLHCVTTAWLELGKYAPIGQEFELVVLNDLEFQLTLQTKLEEPKIRKVLESPTKIAKVQKPSTFSRVFASPKKRKELEMKQQEEAERVAKQKQLDAQASKRNAQPTAWDLLHNLVAKDGSFARSYVCLKDHENQSFGKPYTVDVPCFNEWATEEIRTINSMKSNRSTPGTMQRKAPYKIGKLELQLLFVPKPKDAKDEDMPKSMNACIRELQEAEVKTIKSWEGHLSQQGGDCPYWRRRFFRLDGSKLTAYHEATRQPRATINLAKANRLIDDKRSLTQKDVLGKGGSRRKSAFAEEEEGYMFVEEGFRVRFANGETIDFYADSAAEKDGWMRVLADVVGKDFKQVKTWTDIVLAKHRQTAAAKASRVAEQGQMKPPISSSAGMRSAPPTPGPRQGSSQAHHHAKHSSHPPPPPVEKDPRHHHHRAPLTAAEQRRQKTRSMIF